MPVIEILSAERSQGLCLCNYASMPPTLLALGVGREMVVYKDRTQKTPATRLRVIPFYTGDETIDDVLRHPASLRLLWIEILLNEDFPLKKYHYLPEVQAAYEKACIWYGRFKTMVDGHIGRTSLDAKQGKIDEKEYRKFMEAINFVTD